ncbi:DUF6602 domain-containing protein [Halarcobacter sp.]|uniref:DUF6602 domain-containing protein n=1 Tax=Halarcobacter sp. TaxID=2321133 RepID=UPI003B00DBB2
MSMKLYYESINNEFIALKERITYLIGYTHHPTTGGYNEALLKDFISRYLPENIGVSRGFVVFNQRQDNNYEIRRNDLEYNSNELDILLYDKTRPTLYKSDDLVIVDVHSVKGIIEVKATLRANQVYNIVDKFKRNISKINELKNEKIYSGIFAYEVDSFNKESFLDELQYDTNRNLNNVINHICLGINKFIKFWENDPSYIDNDYYKWHLYKFNDNLAMGYFIYNLITYFTNENDRLWFPSRTKESYLLDSRRINELT